jgi:two-component system chemotaxis response regulator CheY
MTTFGFVTSESTPAMRQEATDAGAAFLLAKPFSADDFQSLLAGVL